MRRALIAFGIGLSVLGSTVVTGPAQAASVLMVPLAPTVTEGQQTARFWLADGAANLRNATPYAVQAVVAGERLSTDIVPDGPPLSYPPLEKPEGEISTTSGKVFFIGSDLQPHWCTGTAVRSKYRNVVATAGHCLLDVEAPAGPLAKWVFVPGYSDGTTPFGLYVGKQGNVHYDFDDIRDYDRDLAFVNVYNGLLLSSSDVLTDTGQVGRQRRRPGARVQPAARAHGRRPRLPRRPQPRRQPSLHGRDPRTVDRIDVRDECHGPPRGSARRGGLPVHR